MTSAQLQTIEEIFHSALERAPAERDQFLRHACAGDGALREQVEKFLRSRERAGDFIVTPSLGLATRILEASPPDPLPGQRLGHYELSERIGAGGMGDVYLATDLVAGRKAAVKLLPLRFTGEAERMRRFAHEARALVALNHPNIVTVYEIGEDRSTHYIASELIDGETLRQRLERGPMKIEEAVEVAIQVTSALVAAHEAGIVHRDIKPENIMLRPDGYAKVLDFGIAKLAEEEAAVPQANTAAFLETRLGSIMGTARYMSPEQARGAVIDQRSDIWSLGAVLYEMLAARPPFAGTDTAEVIGAILSSDPPPFSRQIPADLQQIVGRMLRKEPGERYPDARELSEALKQVRRQIETAAESAGLVSWTRGGKWVRRNPTYALVAAALVGLAAVAGWDVWKSANVRPPITTGIAVLPFENLGEQKQNAAFVDGLQDDILTKLAKIASIKVISRTSVMEFRGKRNVRQIGEALRVSHVLEGSARRDGNRIHLNAQLIDTRSDTHVWAEQYDRDLKELFALQTEIAQEVAGQLHAKIAPAERAAIEQRPTSDLHAYDLYVQAVSLIDHAVYGSDQGERDCLQAVKLLNQAIARDPNFLLAYCRLAEAHSTLYTHLGDHTAGRLALAKSAVDAAFRVRPGSGEAHLALGRYIYESNRDYDRARDELAIAARTLPNDPQIFQWNGYIDRRQSRWHDAARNLERAMELDPQNIEILTDASGIYVQTRRYAQAKAIVDRQIALEPNRLRHRERRAVVDFMERGDIRPLRAVVEQAFAQQPSSYWQQWFILYVALCERDAVSAAKALAASDGSGFNATNGGETWFSQPVWEGLVARMKGDTAAAQAAFTAARVEQEKAIHDDPDHGPTLCVLGLIDAALGRKDEALREGRRALELAPIAKDVFNGTDVLHFYAVICAWTGEYDLAFEQLETFAKIPAGANYGDLRLNPMWDPLRSDPRFDKIVASLAPK